MPIWIVELSGATQSRAMNSIDKNIIDTLRTALMVVSVAESSVGSVSSMATVITAVIASKENPLTYNMDKWLIFSVQYLVKPFPHFYYVPGFLTRSFLSSSKSRSEGVCYCNLRDGTYYFFDRIIS